MIRSLFIFFFFSRWRHLVESRKKKGTLILRVSSFSVSFQRETRGLVIDAKQIITTSNHARSKLLLFLTRYFYIDATHGVWRLPCPKTTFLNDVLLFLFLFPPLVLIAGAKQPNDSSLVFKKDVRINRKWRRKKKMNLTTEFTDSMRPHRKKNGWKLEDGSGKWNRAAANGKGVTHGSQHHQMDEMPFIAFCPSRRFFFSTSCHSIYKRN